jgi:hypothetical protein
MGRIRHHRHHHFLTVEVSLVSAAEMVLYIARKRNIIAFSYLLQELIENLLSRLLQYAVQSVESSSVSHPDENVLHACECCALNELLKGCRPCVEPFNSVASEIGKFRPQKIHKDLIFCNSSEGNQLLFFCGLYPLKFLNFFLKLRFDIVSFFLIKDMLIFKADFVTVDTDQPVLEFFDSVGTIIFFGALSSEVLNDDRLLQLFFFVAELCR